MSPKAPRAVRRLICVSLFAALLLAACERGDADAPDPAMPATGTEAAVTAPTATPEPDNAKALDLAQEDARQKARALVMPMVDTIQAIAVDLEARQAGPTSTSRAPAEPREPSEPETGKVDPSNVRAVFAQHQAAFQRCYERALKRDSSLQGKITLSVVIGSSGKVSKANVTGVTLQDSEMNRCMEGQVRAMNFAKPQGGAVRVNMPMSFQPQF